MTRRTKSRYRSKSQKCTSLRVQYRNLEDLKCDPANSRIHSPKQTAQIAKSIKEFGLNVPFLINAENRIIAGHGRAMACRLVGISRVPTIRLAHLSENQIRAFAIADNRLAQNAQWDEQLLAEQFKILADAGLNFDLEITGFEAAEIDLLIEGLEPVPNKNDPADHIPKLPAEVRITQPGDLWRLSKHFILCGSALEHASCRRLMQKRRAAMVFTDPPFNVKIDGHATGLGGIRHSDFAMACGEMSSGEFTDFLSTALSNAAAHSEEGSLHFVCIDWRHVGEMLAAGSRTFAEFKNMCIWVKDNAGMGSLYRSQHELVFVFKKGRESHRNNIRLGEFGRYRTNVWNYAGVNSFSRKTSEGNLLELHPTVKPVALVADAILDVTKRGDIVLDPFVGSGTTIIAAERTGRICHALELDPLYVDTAIRRWQRFTQQDAVKVGTKETFNQLERRQSNEQESKRPNERSKGASRDPDGTK